MRKLIRTLQSEVPYAKGAKNTFMLWSRRLLRKPHEPDFRALALLPSGCYLDIGANYGQSIESIRLVQPDAQIIAFEPNPRLAARLVARYKNKRSIKINAFGLSDASGDFKLHIPIYNQGCSTLQSHEFSQRIEAFEGGSVAILAEGAGRPRLEEIESETAQTCEHTGIASYA